MRELKTISLIIFLSLFASCYYDVEELLYPDTDCNIEMISYTNDVVPILSDNCYTCHNAQARFGNVILDSYDELSNYYSSDNILLGAIKHDPGFSAMPQGTAKLLDCQIDKIEAWINQGAPNN